MTDDATVNELLQVYADAPMLAGDVALLLDGKVCLEVERLATEWDEQLCRNTAQILRETTSSALIAVARADGALLPTDFQLWRDLHQELRDSDVQLLPIRALPAA